MTRRVDQMILDDMSDEELETYYKNVKVITDGLRSSGASYLNDINGSGHWIAREYACLGSLLRRQLK